MSESVNVFDKIGKYELRRQVGRGAMGVVYEAWDSHIERRVALKTLRIDRFDSADIPDMLARFKREAQAVGRLSHPNIITIYDYGDHNGMPFLVMEFMDGRELAKDIKRSARFPLNDGIRIVGQMLEALSHAHARGVIHRDLKPANMFLLNDGSLKVVDFGLARMEDLDLTILTRENTVLGTPAYMSPEQVDGLQLDNRSDLFSAAIILYELLVGERPFKGESVHTTQQQVRNANPLPPSEMNPALSSSWDKVIMRGLAKKPSDRFESAQQFSEAIQDAFMSERSRREHTPQSATKAWISGDAKDTDRGPQPVAHSAFGTGREAEEAAFDRQATTRPAAGPIRQETSEKVGKIAVQGTTTSVQSGQLRLTVLDHNTPSIAVLPFLDMSAGGGYEYFADGLAEELLNVLAKISGMRVVSRTSAFSFKGMDVDIPTVARKLNVSTILEGSVRTDGKRVRVTVQLINVATDSHLWSETYDRDLDDIFAVQDGIASAVVSQLRQTLMGNFSMRGAPGLIEPKATYGDSLVNAVKGRSENAEAYRLYLHARYFANKLTRGSGTRAISYFTDAIGVDSRFALAWAGLSNEYTEAVSTGSTSLAVGYQKAREAAERALQLEPDLAEGHAALGRIQMMCDWDWEGADRSFSRALELAPGDAHIVSHAAWLPGNLGRIAEAGVLVRKAVTLDPLSATAFGHLAHLSLNDDSLEDAEAAAKKMLELNLEGEFGHDFLGLAYLIQGRLENALSEFQQEKHEAYRLRGIAMAQHACGCRIESDHAVSTLIEKYADVAAFQIAQVYSYRDLPELAFGWLERAFVQRDPGITEMKNNFLLRKLHADDRWLPFLIKMRLED